VPSAEGSSLDATARDALERLVRIVNRCGFSPSDIERAVCHAILNLPKQQGAAAPATEREMPSAPHVLTVWHDDPRYMDEHGQPRRLPRHGRAPSFEALVRSVDRRLHAGQVLQYLMRAGAVRRARGKYLAVKRLVILRGISGPRDFRNLRGVDAMLRTAEHNSMPASEAPGWLERMAENSNFPVSQLSEFAPFLERETMGYLGRLDAYMRSAEVERKAGEPTIKLGVGMYRFQEERQSAEAMSVAANRRVGRSRARRSS
jgi:hypothetical protein